jgi:hypothetical protein
VLGMIGLDDHSDRRDAPGDQREDHQGSEEGPEKLRIQI